MADETEKGRFARIAAAARQMDRAPGVVSAVERMRRVLPGDEAFGDQLSVAGDRPEEQLGRRLSALSETDASATRQVALGALQIWQALSEAQGRGRGPQRLAILFTDLERFSSWALNAGDTATLGLLRELADVAEPPIEDRGGRIVKRLGDGLMAVFTDPVEALWAALDARDAVAGIEIDGYRPRLRAGVHVGLPRRLGGDYLGVDVNIAARVAEAASGGQVLASEAVCSELSDQPLKLKNVRRFKGKGVPKGFRVFSVERELQDG